jgi:polyhydroxyalkanoate synthesis regulator phasin
LERLETNKSQEIEELNEKVQGLEEKINDLNEKHHQ